MKRARSVLAVSLLFLWGAVLPADAQTPVGSMLHEFVAPDPEEDVSLAATTLDGNLPAAIDTPSGVATAPDPQRPPDPNHLYTGGSTDDSPDSTFPPDRDTSQPDIENYDDPFSPSTAPFKRLRAYDSVDFDYTLKVASRSTSLLSVGGDATADDEPFYADLSVELLPDELVRVPTVGPGTRVLKMHTSPNAQVSLLRDGAENWFIRGTEHKRVRLVMQLAIPRATFGSAFRDAEWNELDKLIPAFAHHDVQAQRVFDAIGINTGMRPKDVVTKMVEYYRGFVPSKEPPKVHGDIFLDLALTKKGVCRHRAFAFLVTALQIGIPARMVVNEAHAWVEVNDSVMWHRIDLGGAALDLDQSLDPTRPQHQPPADPFAWPENQQNNSGQALSDREHGGNTPSDPNGQSDPNGSSATPDPNGDPLAPSNVPSDLPASRVEVDVAEKTVRRGKTLALKGKVSGANPCKNVRVDVVLKVKDQAGRAIGSLSTDGDGQFDGSVVVPRDFGAGDYEVIVVTRGDKTCGPGRSE